MDEAIKLLGNEAIKLLGYEVLGCAAMWLKILNQILNLMPTPFIADPNTTFRKVSTERRGLG